MPVAPHVETLDEGPNGAGSLGRLIPWPDDETYPNIPAEEALDLFLVLLAVQDGDGTVSSYEFEDDGPSGVSIGHMRE